MLLQGAVEPFEDMLVVGADDGGVADASEAVEAAGETDEFDGLSEAFEDGVVLLGL